MPLVGVALLGWLFAPPAAGQLSEGPRLERQVTTIWAERADRFHWAWERADEARRAQALALLDEARGPGGPRGAWPDLVTLTAGLRVLAGAPSEGLLRQLREPGLETLVDALDLQVLPGFFAAADEGRGDPLTVRVWPVDERAVLLARRELLVSLIWIAPDGEEIRARTEPIGAEALRRPGFDMFIRAPLSRPGTWHLVLEVSERVAETGDADDEGSEQGSEHDKWEDLEAEIDAQDSGLPARALGWGSPRRGHPVPVECVRDFGERFEPALDRFAEVLASREVASLESSVDELLEDLWFAWHRGERFAGGSSAAERLAYLAAVLGGESPLAPLRALPQPLPVEARTSALRPDWWVHEPAAPARRTLIALSPSDLPPEALFHGGLGARWAECAEASATRLCSSTFELNAGPTVHELVAIARLSWPEDQIGLLLRGDATTLFYLALFGKPALDIDFAVISAPFSEPGGALPEVPTLLISPDATPRPERPGLKRVAVEGSPFTAESLLPALAAEWLAELASGPGEGATDR